MTTYNQEEKSVQLFEKYERVKYLALFYCVSEYPVPLAEVYLFEIKLKAASDALTFKPEKILLIEMVQREKLKYRCEKVNQKTS